MDGVIFGWESYRGEPAVGYCISCAFKALLCVAFKYRAVAGWRAAGRGSVVYRVRAVRPARDPIRAAAINRGLTLN
ncbi:hypothetical protein EVAR_61423_1 [Eumeta japonica]|uniref:Uncharacterized protein n=1 Tax=Eumeta variegata TaxID=151549 RepID=A0A4C1Y3N8_EUMVA|nr:hypothetical protein EVAR_61423_1 [Eumeta japonica]